MCFLVMTVGELMDICEIICREHGPNAKIVIEFRKENGTLISADCIEGYSKSVDGTLFLSNKPFKLGSCE